VCVRVRARLCVWGGGGYMGACARKREREWECLLNPHPRILKILFSHFVLFDNGVCVDICYFSKSNLSGYKG
jgi:hypothetical protein